MTPERLRRIEALFHSVREADADARAALLADAEPGLRRDVESLLAAQGAEFLDRPPVQATPAQADASVLTGETKSVELGPYRIEGKLGAGGMGDVYRAVDTRLGREVAVKIAQPGFVQRFEREARAISSLNHPHICTLYDVGPNYLVMELVEGETLASRLKRGPLPSATALLYASQILAALAQAHGKGVVHRDLKPGNIMIGSAGIKVLDFGLAKSGQDESITLSGMVLGTPAYMAPEQRAGTPADARADIYAFGCVLYEMLAGARIAMHRKRLASRRLERIVERCLKEDPSDRWPSVGELARELPPTAGARRATRGAPAGNADPESQVALGDAPTRAGSSTIVLAEFVNATGDRVFDGTLQQVVAEQLDHSPRLRVLPAARVRQTLGLMGRPAGTALTGDVAADICERTSSSAVVEGSITCLGNEYAVSLRARHWQSGDILHHEQAQAPRKEDVFGTLARMARRFGTRAGESIPAVEAQPSLPTDATTSSQEAWRSFSAAMKGLQARAQSTESLPLLKRATEIDPAFALAFAHLGRLHSDLGEPETGAPNITRAYELRESVSDRENYFITFNYHRQVTRNLELGRQTLESWKQKYPSDLLPRGFLSGFVSAGVGAYDTVVEEGLKAIGLDPDFAIGYENVAWALVYVNRPSEAEALLRKAAARRIEVTQFSLLRYALACSRHDTAAMEREAVERRTTARPQGAFEHQEALACACRGRWRDAARLSDRAVTLARQGGLLERSAQFAGARAAWSALVDNAAEARSSAAAALSLCRSRDADYGPALALTILDDPARDEIAANLERAYPQDTSVQFSYLPVLTALAALNRADPARALELTDAAAPYDLAIPATAYFTGAFFGALYPVYVRGLAYGQLGRPHDAAREFQSILDRPGLVLNDPIGSMTRLQLARALSACGDRARSTAAYEDLLTLWKDADPDAPAVQQARAEYARIEA